MNKDVSLTIIDIMGKINNGVGILYSFKIKDKIYELIYWFDKYENFRLEVDNNFLNDFNLDDIYNYDNLLPLVEFIEKNIPNKEELLKNYL